MEIDITHVILKDPPTRTRPGGRIVRRAIQAWLEQNVGPYYGEDNTSLLRSVSVGVGWKFGTQTIDKNDTMSIKWIVDIADKRLAAMFMLRFL